MLYISEFSWLYLWSCVFEKVSFLYWSMKVKGWIVKLFASHNSCWIFLRSLSYSFSTLFEFQKDQCSCFMFRRIHTTFFKTQYTLIPPNSRILRVGIFGYVSLEPRVFSTKSGFQTRYLLNNKNSELENSASLEPRFREGLV